MVILGREVDKKGLVNWDVFFVIIGMVMSWGCLRNVEEVINREVFIGK